VGGRLPDHPGDAAALASSPALWEILRAAGTLRREVLDQILIMDERHLTTLLVEYLIHYDGHRPHRSRQQRPPEIDVQPTQAAAAVTDLSSIRRKQVVTGLINESQRAA
jgi:hypothetical protein